MGQRAPRRSEPLGCREVRRKADDHRSVRQPAGCRVSSRRIDADGTFGGRLRFPSWPTVVDRIERPDTRSAIDPISLRPSLATRAPSTHEETALDRTKKRRAGQDPRGRAVLRLESACGEVYASLGSVASISAWRLDVGQGFEIEFDDGLQSLGGRAVRRARHRPMRRIRPGARSVRRRHRAIAAAGYVGQSGVCIGSRASSAGLADGRGSGLAVRRR